MDPLEAAQAIFPSLARPLQKYLRITRQQPRNTVESIIHHLATCLTHDLSARAFIEKFVETSPVLQNSSSGWVWQTCTRILLETVVIIMVQSAKCRLAPVKFYTKDYGSGYWH
ncbi:hypothetical protein QYM36_008183 [Artemia franciscana]|uniref:Uncharacterized protein n=1 Tax=Artemia franciscana TaxID=6661 RepID=A0AA88IUI7_ARTSF|nr:hypothetical protein QYM36_008183 [Artemia franciscana]